MYVCEAFASYGAGLAQKSLPDEVLHHARRAVIDWYAALIPGSVMQVTTKLQAALSDELDTGSALLALGQSANVRAAALINGTASHAAEVDDIYKYAIYHPGAPTISAALALAQHLKANGEDFLRAVIAGYEISTRIGKALGRDHYKFWHNTGTVGVFGSAAAGALLLKLNAEEFAHALATAATFAAGLQQAFKMDSMSKPLHSGRAAEAGLLAAMGAAQGMTGSLDVLEGEFGMGRAMSNDPDWQEVLADIHDTYNICSVTFKNHACCGHTFAPIDGAIVLRGQHNIEPGQVRRVVVSTYGPALDVAGNPSPATAAEARFSIPFVVATALTHGSVRLAAFSDERLADPGLRSLMSRIELAVDPVFDTAFPGQRAARVFLETVDGKTFEAVQPTRKGDPDMPLSDAELQEKFNELVEPVLGNTRTAFVSQKLWSLNRSASLDDLCGKV
ncbi:MmgE/PrpD family protein [Pusillimonas sp. MFBS29]|uniref:MmgE/PrpD family protein n=1 Tax=Pusillimonas sp. MFBS29 TaxID=2886690 RepID=UPI001D12921E|nr:MmgE/PrpD family protein [Pusillimonas sp. MFBS29]MCC2595836.1 MmgE/PrpD family protein [Pusillimonas sp. MFBS29]